MQNRHPLPSKKISFAQGQAILNPQKVLSQKIVNNVVRKCTMCFAGKDKRRALILDILKEVL